jgi:hypothetical protein
MSPKRREAITSKEGITLKPRLIYYFERRDKDD